MFRVKSVFPHVVSSRLFDTDLFMGRLFLQTWVGSTVAQLGFQDAHKICPVTGYWFEFRPKNSFVSLTCDGV